VKLNKNAQSALAAINREPTENIPIGLVHIMEHSVIERIAKRASGSYAGDPHNVYMEMLDNIGVSMVDQYLADNPLTMDRRGYRGGAGATTGKAAVCDGIVIDSPEAVALHIEKYQYPRIIETIKNFDAEKVKRDAINCESFLQRLLGPDILKAGYGMMRFPGLDYFQYGYEPYFTAYAIYPELIDRLFSLRADYALMHNAAVVEAYVGAGLPLYHRLDHDMADSRGLLVGLKTLERAWLPCLAHSIKPAVDAGFALLWHCDGNLSELLPGLVECGINGFQGFQYEDGMDYKKICKMKMRDGSSPIIQAGVSVTRELPFGTPGDVMRQVDFLVEHGPKAGLFLAFSSSCVPGTPYENIEAAIEVMKSYNKL